MQDKFRTPVFAPPPKEYDQKYMDHVIREIRTWIIEMKTAGSMTMGPSVTLQELPTSSSGLRTGELWNDSGTVKIKV